MSNCKWVSLRKSLCFYTPRTRGNPVWTPEAGEKQERGFELRAIGVQLVPDVLYRSTLWSRGSCTCSVHEDGGYGDCIYFEWKEIQSCVVLQCIGRSSKVERAGLFSSVLRRNNPLLPNSGMLCAWFRDTTRRVMTYPPFFFRWEKKLRIAPIRRYVSINGPGVRKIASFHWF